MGEKEFSLVDYYERVGEFALFLRGVGRNVHKVALLHSIDVVKSYRLHRAAGALAPAPKAADAGPD